MNAETNLDQSQMNLVAMFMAIGGQTTNQCNPRQATFYVGMICEELAETLEEIRQGQIDCTDDFILSNNIQNLKQLGNRLKSGMHEGSLTRADPEKLLDGMLDTAWVSMAAALSYSTFAQGAFREVARANLDKYPGGQVIKDENGKIQKPDGWRGPDLSSFIDSDRLLPLFPEQQR